MLVRGIGVGFIVVWGVCSAAADDGAAIADRRIVDYSASLESRGGLTNAVWRLCTQTKTPCGLEFDANPPDIDKYSETFAVSSATLGEVLDLIVQHLPGYRWSLADGVVNIQPESRPWRWPWQMDWQHPLDRTIEGLELSPMPSKAVAFKMCPAASLETLPRIAFGVPKSLGRTISLKLPRVTLREALNAVVREDGLAMWEFGPVETGSDICRLNFESYRPFEWNPGSKPSSTIRKGRK